MSDKTIYLYKTAFVYFHPDDHGKEYEGWTIYLTFHHYSETHKEFLRSDEYADIGPFTSKKAATEQMLKYLDGSLNPTMDREPLNHHANYVSRFLNKVLLSITERKEV